MEIHVSNIIVGLIAFYGSYSYYKMGLITFKTYRKEDYYFRIRPFIRSATLLICGIGIILTPLDAITVIKDLYHQLIIH